MCFLPLTAKKTSRLRTAGRSFLAVAAEVSSGFRGRTSHKTGGFTPRRTVPEKRGAHLRKNTGCPVRTQGHPRLAVRQGPPLPGWKRRAGPDRLGRRSPGPGPGRAWPGAGLQPRPQNTGPGGARRSRIWSTSLSAMMLTKKTNFSPGKRSRRLWAVACIPCGLWLPSRIKAGEERSSSNRPGQRTVARPWRMAWSEISQPRLRKARSAVMAVAALQGW